MSKVVDYEKAKRSIEAVRSHDGDFSVLSKDENDNLIVFVENREEEQGRDPGTR